MEPLPIEQKKYEYSALIRVLEEDLDMDQELLDNLEEKNITKLLHDLINYDEITFYHVIRVARFAGLFHNWVMNYKGENPEVLKIRNYFRLNDFGILDMVIAGLVHDAGKLEIPHKYLNKPGERGDLDIAVQNIHVQVAEEVLRERNVKFDDDSLIYKVVWEHHENADGTGYPSAMKLNISMAGLIFRGIDSIESMTDTSHKTAYTKKESYEEIEKDLTKSKYATNYDQKVVGVILEFLRDQEFTNPLWLKGKKIKYAS